jgi:hypothetical protein
VDEVGFHPALVEIDTGTDRHAGEHGPDLSALVVTEHARLRRSFATVLGETDERARRFVFEEFSKDVTKHETVEEELLYVIIANSSNGTELRTVGLSQERELAAQLFHVARALTWRPRSRQARRRLRELGEILERHFSFEEQHVLPVILAGHGELNRQVIGTWAERAERFAPTRPHPHGPRRLSGLLTVGVALSLADRIRDALRRALRSRA